MRLAATDLFVVVRLFRALLVLFFFHPDLTPSPTIRATNSAPLLLATAGSGQANPTAPAPGGRTCSLATTMLTFYQFLRHLYHSSYSILEVILTSSRYLSSMPIATWAL